MEWKDRRGVLFVSLLFVLLGFVGTAFGTDLIVNGGFEAGNTGFSSQYTYTPTNNNATQYFIGSNTKAWNNNFVSFSPQEGSLMMIVNGATDASKVLWQETISVTPGATYDFSTWGRSAADQVQLKFTINGTQIGSAFTLLSNSSNNGLWQEFSTPWDSGSITTATISIFDLSTGFGGNDFAIDNIALNDRGASPVPEPSTLILLGSGLVGLGGFAWRWHRKS